MENLVVVKVVETKVTVYTVKGDFNGEQAKALVESYHSLGDCEVIDHMDKVDREGSQSEFKAHVDYQLRADRPEPSPSKHPSQSRNWQGTR